MLIKKKKPQLRSSVGSVPDEVLRYLNHAKASTELDESQVINNILQKNLKNIEVSKSELLSTYKAQLDEKKANAEKRIEETINQANQEALNIIAQAKEAAALEAERISQLKSQLIIDQQQFREDLEIEKKQVYETAMNEAQSFISELGNAIASFNHAKQEVLLECKEQITAIGLDVARKILDYEVNHNPNLLESQVLKAVSKVIDSKGIMQVFLNSEDLAEKQMILQELLSNIIDPNVRLIFMKDDNVNPGSCMINTQGGRLDASFSTQISTIKEALERYLGHKISELPLDNSEEYEELEAMPEKKNVNIKEKLQAIQEPSDEDLSELEENFSEYVDLDIEDDFEDLIDNMYQDKKAKTNKAEKKVEKVSKPVKNKAAKAFEPDDEIEAVASDESAVYEADDYSDDEFADDEEAEFVEFDEFAGDDNFGDTEDSDGSSDDRFPEY